MSSKLNVKQSKKDRPRSSDKLKGKGKRDGTPDKSATPNPSQDNMEESPQQTRNVIYNEDIEKLIIRDEDLQKIREPRPPSGVRSPQQRKTLTVRKMKPASEWDQPPPKVVHVLRQAPADAPLKQMDLSWMGGPRLDNEGEVVKHSILGDVEEFKTQAILNGHLEEVPLPPSQASSVEPPTVKYEKKRKFPTHVSMAQVDECNALKNWRAKMLERKRQQGYISKLLQKPPETLVMNRGDAYRKKQEERYLIERSIPAMDYGKGYRVGSEFWKQQERFGDDLTGIHMTLSQTEKGYAPPIEHIGIPEVVREEKGNNWESRCTTPLNYPWDKPKSWRKSDYRDQRIAQLAPVMTELDPYNPAIKGLQILGSNQPNLNSGPIADPDRIDWQWQKGEEGMEEELEEKENADPLRDHPDVYEVPTLGPSILFGGEQAAWSGDSFQREEELALESRVTFETYAGSRVTSFLDIVNNGTTCIYYNWKKNLKTNPFDIVNAKVQRFYFNTSPGVILPGEALKFPFIFKSPNAGVFTEQWQFQTKPVVCSGAALVVTLRGISLQEDKYLHKRLELEDDLAQRQATQVVSQIINGIIDGIKTPERSRSPIDAYITDEEIFERKNPGLHFTTETVNTLRNLYLELFTEEEKEGQQWNLDISTLEDMIMDMDPEDERKDDFLHRLNLAVVSLSFPPFSPKQQLMYNVGYHYLTDVVDQMVGQSMLIRHTMGLPERENDDLPDDSTLRHELHSRSDSKKAKTDGKKDGKAPAKGGKDVKAAKGGKESAKDKPAKGAKPPSKPPSRSGPTPPTKSDSSDRPMTPGSRLGSPQLSEENIQETKYKEKLYLQTYAILSQAVGEMDHVFIGIQEQEGHVPTL